MFVLTFDVLSFLFVALCLSYLRFGSCGLRSSGLFGKASAIPNVWIAVTYLHQVGKDKLLKLLIATVVETLVESVTIRGAGQVRRAVM